MNDELDTRRYMMIGKQKVFLIILKMKEWRNDIYKQLVSFKRDTLVDRRIKVIGQSAHGLNLAWSFMEHAWGIKCGKMRHTHRDME